MPRSVNGRAKVTVVRLVRTSIGTLLASPGPARVTCPYLMSPNLSNRQTAEELGLSGANAQLTTERLRHGLAARTPAAALEGEVEIDEVQVAAGHEGQPAVVAEGGRSGGVVGWRERRAAARWRRTSRRSSGLSRAAGGWRCGCWPMSGRRRSSRSSGPRSPGTPS